MADYSNPHNAYGYGYGYGDDSGYQAHRNTEGRPGPLSSPFDDDQFSYRHNQPSPSSYPSTPQGMMGAQSDPFEDDDAVPLRNYRPKHASQTSVAPIVTPEYNDPFVRDVKRQGRRRSQRDIPLQSGWFKGQITWVCFILSIIQIAVFIAELARNAVLTGSPVEIHPQFNPMIGPSPYVLINMGARYQPCMHNMHNVTDFPEIIYWPCPNATSLDNQKCTLSDLCGFRGVPNPRPNGSLTDTPAPDQWWRFIVPIFLHAGFIHIGFNLLLQLTLGRDMERKIGPIRFTIVYFASGIFGFVLGGNFAANGIASTGCSGSLFGILALDLLDLLYWWRERPGPIKDLLFILVDIAISFVLGLLPGLDNFSHIGGFLIGLVLGVCILRTPASFSHDLVDEVAYDPMNEAKNTGLSRFMHEPLRFFQGRKTLWWVWWFVRAGALIGIIVGFIVLLKNFYVWQHGCSWCKYLSCLNINNWCSIGYLSFSDTSNQKRSLLDLTKEVFEQPVNAVFWG